MSHWGAVPTGDRDRAHGDATVDELRSYGRALGASPATLQRLRAHAHDAYVSGMVVTRATAAIPRSFLGRRMPLVLTALTLLAAMFGDISLCTGLSVFGFGTLATRAPQLLGAPFTAIAVLVLIGGACEIALAFGFWKRQPWAWPLGVVVETAMLVLALSWIVVGAFVMLQVLRALVSVAILAVLDHRDVRAALEQRPWTRQLAVEEAAS